MIARLGGEPITKSAVGVRSTLTRNSASVQRVLPPLSASVSVSLPTGIMPIAVGVGVPIDQMECKRNMIVTALVRVKKAFEH